MNTAKNERAGANLSDGGLSVERRSCGTADRLQSRQLLLSRPLFFLKRELKVKRVLLVNRLTNTEGNSYELRVSGRLKRLVLKRTPWEFGALDGI